MTNLGGTYSALGRYQDALAMREQALDFSRRFLPQNHPEIGARNFSLRVDLTFWRDLLTLGSAMCDLAVSLTHAGQLYRAISLSRQALETMQAILPPSHSRVEMAQVKIHSIEEIIALRASKKSA